MENNKISFLKKLIMAISDFRIYPIIVKNEKISSSISYFTKIIILATLIISLSFAVKINYFLKQVIENYELYIPEFELVLGKLNVNQVVNEKLNNNNYLMIDTSYTYEEYKETDDYSRGVIYDSELLLCSDSFVIESNGESLIKLDFQEIPFNINKSELYSILSSAYNSGMYKIYFVVTMAVSLLAVLFITLFVRIMYNAIIIALISLITGLKMTFSNYLKVSIYSFTLPLIIQVIAICLNVASQNYTYYTVTLLTYIYIIYAIRAVRLDAFISFINNTVAANNVEKSEDSLKDIDKENDLNQEKDDNNEKKDE